MSALSTQVGQAFRTAGMPALDESHWDAAWQRIMNPTREDRIEMAYLALAGQYPGPNRSAIAAILAHRIVDLQDAEDEKR